MFSKGIATRGKMISIHFGRGSSTGTCWHATVSQDLSLAGSLGSFDRQTQYVDRHANNGLRLSATKTFAS